MTEPKESPETEPVIVTVVCDRCGRNGGKELANRRCWKPPCPGTMRAAVARSEYERLHKAALMVAADAHFWFSTEDDGKGPLKLVVNVNDTFGYACADAEEVPFDLLDEAWAAHLECRSHGTLLWAQKRRGGLPFITPVQMGIEICPSCRSAPARLAEGGKRNG